MSLSEIMRKRTRKLLRSAARKNKRFRAPGAVVLVMDDIPVNLMLLSKLLDNAEIQSDTALSGEQAIELAMKKKYDIMIFDQILPGMSGIETLRTIRGARNTPNVLTPAICLTASTASGVKENLPSSGFDDCLSMPLDPEKLEEMLMKYLPEKKAEQFYRDRP